MSETPDDESGNGGQGDNSEGGQPEGGQGGQPEGGQPQGGQPQGGQPQGPPPQDGQPQGGQGEQPQGGQPQGGQPQGGQPQGQQPQGGQPQGQPAGGQPQGGHPQGPPPQQAPVNTGPGIGDIFSRQDTMDEIKQGVVGFALVAVGVGVAVMLNGLLASQTSPGYFIALLMLLGSFALPPLIGIIVANRQSESLTSPPDNLRYATAAVTGAAGSFVFIIVVAILGIIGLGGSGGGGGTFSAPQFGDIVLPLIVIAIGTAITAVGVVWARDNL